MLDGSNPQTLVTHYIKLPSLCNGRKSVQCFLISPIGCHKIILGTPWLKEENPIFNWTKGDFSYEPKEQAADNKMAVDTDPLEEYLQFLTVWNRLKNELLEEAKAASKEEANPNREIPHEYWDFILVFREELFKKPPPHCPYDIDIQLQEDHGLGPAPLYSMTLRESAELKPWVEKELASSKICPSKSPIASPVMFVEKKDGSLHVVVNYRKLNAATEKNLYPLPRQEDLMAKLQGAKFFTKLDL